MIETADYNSIKITKNMSLHIRAFAVYFLLAISAKNSMASVESAVNEHEVVPDVVATAPKELVKVTYPNGKQVNLGAELTPTQVKDEPKVEWNADPNTFYTLIMTDPDAPSRTEPTFREVNHWLVGNIKGQDINSGNVIRAYRGSGAPQGTGLHRYVFLIYKQPGQLQFDEDHVANNSRKDRLKFSAKNFAKKYNLGEPIAANLFQAQWDEYVPILQQLSSDN